MSLREFGERTEDERPLSRRQRWLRHGPEFLDWLEETQRHFKCFEKIAESLDSFLSGKLQDKQILQQFANDLQHVLSRCDDNIYEDIATVLSYAHVHFLERYQRFWQVLILLVRAAILPVRSKGIGIVDVGTGPAPSAYAINDFYRALRDFACERNVEALNFPLPQVRCVERGRGMQFFMHHFSEAAGQPGPYGPTWSDFAAFDAESERKFEREARIQNLIEEDDLSEHLARRLINEEEPWLNENWLYDLCIFSNFLTKVSDIGDFKQSMSSVIRALRPGGLVVVMGGVDGQYPDLYDRLGSLAGQLHLLPITSLPNKVRCRYKEDAEARRIKEHYRRIWTFLEKVLNPRQLRTIQSQLSANARDLWIPRVNIRARRISVFASFAGVVGRKRLL